MSDFTIIETQEQLDTVISDRLKRERETIKKQYEGFLSPEEVTKKYEGFLSPDDEKTKYKDYLSPEEAAKKDAKIKEYETASVKTRIAHEMGLSYEAIGFLKGDDEDSIKESAESLKSLMGTRQMPPPASTETSGSDSKDAALLKTLRGLNKEGE